MTHPHILQQSKSMAKVEDINQGRAWRGQQAREGRQQGHFRAVWGQSQQAIVLVWEGIKGCC